MNQSNEAGGASALRDSADMSRRNVLEMTGTGIAALSARAAAGPAAARSAR